MPPAERKQPKRQTWQAAAAQAGLSPEVIVKRTKKHLEELERTNYTEPTVSLAGIALGEGPGMNATARGRARETISDKRAVDGLPRKKNQTKNVRDALVYRKHLATLIEESGITQLPPEIPTYLTAAAPPPTEPPRLLCTVCGYWGRYKCRRCSMAFCNKKCEDTHYETTGEQRMY